MKISIFLAVILLVWKTQAIVSNSDLFYPCRRAKCPAILDASCSNKGLKAWFHIAGQDINCECGKNEKVMWCDKQDPCKDAICYPKLYFGLVYPECMKSACGSCHARFYIGIGITSIDCRDYCKLPPAPANGAVKSLGQFTDPLVNQKVQYSCNEGFKLVGNTDITCMGNLKYSGSSPACQRCKVPIFKNGKSDPDTSHIAVGDSISFSCNEHYYLLFGSTGGQCYGDGKIKRKFGTHTTIQVNPRCQECLCKRFNLCKGRTCVLHPDATECSCECREAIFTNPNTGAKYNSQKCKPPPTFPPKPPCLKTCKGALCAKYKTAVCSINHLCAKVFTHPVTKRVYSEIECSTSPPSPPGPNKCQLHQPLELDQCRFARCTRYPQASTCRYDSLTCQTTFAQVDENGKVIAVYTELECRKCSSLVCARETCPNYPLARCTANAKCEPVFVDPTTQKEVQCKPCLGISKCPLLCDKFCKVGHCVRDSCTCKSSCSVSPPGPSPGPSPGP